jgi:DNA-binding transcriptional LysR family regulator
MDLRQLTIFREVAKNLSFTKAAVQLNYVQSNVTAQIHALEEELGQPLFDRLGRQVVLTDAGQQLIDYADRLLRLAEEAQTAISTGTTPQGTLRIGASETLCIYRLPALLRAFRSSYPQVHLIFCPTSISERRRLVHEGSIDIAFMLDEVSSISEPGDELMTYEPVWLVAAPDHPFARQQAIGPEDLKGADLLLTEAGCSYRGLFERILNQAKIYPGTVMEFSSLEAVKQCVMTGLGLSVLPLMAVAPEVEQGRLLKLPWAGPDLTISSHMVWHKDKWLSPSLNAFLTMARAMLQTTDLPDRVVDRTESSQIVVQKP